MKLTFEALTIYHRVTVTAGAVLRHFHLSCSVIVPRRRPQGSLVSFLSRRQTCLSSRIRVHLANFRAHTRADELRCIFLFNLIDCLCCAGAGPLIVTRANLLSHFDD